MKALGLLITLMIAGATGIWALSDRFPIRSEHEAVVRALERKASKDYVDANFQAYLREVSNLRTDMNRGFKRLEQRLDGWAGNRKADQYAARTKERKYGKGN